MSKVFGAFRTQRGAVDPRRAPILAGTLVEANLWGIVVARLVFLINVPIGIICLCRRSPCTASHGCAPGEFGSTKSASS